MVINLKGGNDQLTYQLGGGSDFAHGKRITADLGSGDDVATFNFADNGTGGLALIRGALNLDIQAGAGKDQVDAFFGPTTGSDLTLTGNMGYGDDHFNAVLKAYYERLGFEPRGEAVFEDFHAMRFERRCRR